MKKDILTLFLKNRTESDRTHFINRLERLDKTDMEYKINTCTKARFFSVPCKAVDGYLKDASGDYFKVLLYILSAENDTLDTNEIVKAAGVDRETADNAVLYWNKANIIKICSHEKLSGAAGELDAFKDSAEDAAPVKYSAKEVAEIVNSDREIKLLFDQLETTLARELRFTERCGYINLSQYYGFSTQSIVLLVEYCKNIGKTSLRYIETVAKSLYREGLTDYRDVEKAVERMTRSASYAGKVKSLLGINSNLSTRQSEIVESWREANVGNELIKEAYDICLDNTGKLSFPYMNKIIAGWIAQGVKTTADVKKKQSEHKKKSKSSDNSYSLEEFENYSINFLSDKK